MGEEKTGVVLMQQPEEPRPKQSLGPVWVSCPLDEVALLIEEALKAPGDARLHGARLHYGKEPPQGETPSSVVLCCLDSEDVSSAVRGVRVLAPGVPILLFLGSPEDLQSAQSALKEGAHGLLHANMRPRDVACALAAASRRSATIPEEILRYLAAAKEEEEKEEGSGSASSLAAASSLSPQQREVLGLVANGLSNGQVAKRLSLPEHTVKRELHAAYSTLRYKRKIKEAVLSRQSNSTDSLKA
jgi:DNA-binding NarL/FixJ family response regulator